MMKKKVRLNLYSQKREKVIIQGSQKLSGPLIGKRKKRLNKKRER